MQFFITLLHLVDMLVHLYQVFLSDLAKHDLGVCGTQPGPLWLYCLIAFAITDLDRWDQQTPDPIHTEGSPGCTPAPSQPSFFETVSFSHGRRSPHLFLP